MRAKKKPGQDLFGDIQKKSAQDPPGTTSHEKLPARVTQLANLITEPAKERKVSPSFLKRMGWTVEGLKEHRKHWLAKPDSDEKRNALFWEAAKKQAYAAAYQKAQERQKELGSSEWMVAFLLAEGLDREHISAELGIHEDTVDKLIRVVKDIACVETPAHIARWFFGL
jgi:hypothetical protein